MNEYKNKKCLVTGGGGLIGRQLIHLLVDLGANAISVGLDNPEDYSKFIKCDLTHKAFCLEVIKDMDYVFHLAGIKASPNMTNKRPATMSIVPLQMNANVLEACRTNGVKNVLFTSSIGAYAEAEILKEENAYQGDPMDSAPGHVKRIAERQIQWYKTEYGLDYKVVRIANCYGPGDNFNPDNAMFIPSLMAKVLRGDNPVEVWGNGTAIRDFIYSKDVAKGILLMMLNAKDCMPVNLGSGAGYTIMEVATLLNRITPFYFKYDISKPSGIKKRVMNISKAKSLGYNPTYTLSEGLKETWEWFKQHPKEYERRLNYFTKS